jgi:uncharacterized protein YjiK
MFQRYIPLVILTALFGGCGGGLEEGFDTSTGILFPYQWVGNIDRVNFNEPSGIVFYPPRRTLFVVGDEGDICEISPDGAMLRQKRIRNEDFEGITFDPSSGLLYIAVEGKDTIIEVDPEDFSVLREFTIDRTFNGKTVLGAGGEGIEGITFVPDPAHPEGGTFYITNQSFDLDNEEDISAVFEVEAPLRSGTGSESKARILGYFSLGVIDLSAIHYDEESDHLYVVSDATNSIFEVTRDGVIVRSYAFPGDNQEGIAVDDQGYAYIAQDSGGIVKVKWLRQRRGSGSMRRRKAIERPGR